jgi:hypothetical protein
MTTNTLPTAAFGQEGVLGEDLASLACDAAIELDNLILDRTIDLVAARKLADRLTRELPEGVDLSSARSLVDPATIVVMSRAIRESMWAGQPDEMQDLTRMTKQIAERLVTISGDPTAGKADLHRLEQLRAFCLLLSKWAAAVRSSALETRPPHPYRKQG